MLEFLDPRPQVAVAESEYARLLGFPRNHKLDGRVRELADRSRDWYATHGRPWVYARETDEFELEARSLRINGLSFASERLHGQLNAAQAHTGILVLVSAGNECEEQARRFWQEQKPDEYFFLEIFGSAVVEHLVTATGARICAWAEQNGMAALPHYSPGYSGWDVSDQTRLFRLITHANGRTFPSPIQVLETGMLQPKKSLLALFGITRHVDRVRTLKGLVPCGNCSFSPCQYRRAPFVESVPLLEDVRQLQPGAPDRSPLDHNAKYSVNGRALRKWSQEHLQLTTREDGSISARFHYEGTTCSNLGRRLDFHYQIELGPAETGYQINQTACLPAPDDTGHAEMCAYVENAEKLMSSIADEKPLLGRPLNEVLTWQRGASPAGCYCDADSRAHKWGLVLEVIHYALVAGESSD
jgi:hypothetical protein